MATHSKEAGCEFRGEIIEVGQSKFVLDPQLVKEGVSRDWQGYLIRCTREVVQSGNQVSVAAGDVIELGKPILVLSELHEEYYEAINK